MAINADTVSFESIAIGDALPRLEKSESQEDINNHSSVMNRAEREKPVKNQHTDVEYAEQKGFFSGTVNFGVSTVGFMTELLQLAFPTRNIIQGSFSMRAIEPIRADDLITYTGKVLDKREVDGKRLVDVEVVGTNQLGKAVAAAKATVPL